MDKENGIRILIFVYGVVSYFVGLLGLTAFQLWLGGWDFLPWHIDSPRQELQSSSVVVAIVANIVLMLLFGIQHTVMARDSFKSAFTRWIPQSAERSTYVLASGLVMVAFCFYWQTVPGILWEIENESLRVFILTMQVLGWGIAVMSTFFIDHFELFGLQQVYYGVLGKQPPRPQFRQKFLYRIVRHPLQMGVLIGIWSAPTMSMSHALLSSLMTIYILIGLYYEELDLVKTLGQPYVEYQQQVRMLLPIPVFGQRDSESSQDN